MTDDKPKSKKGFASLSPERRKAVAALGGSSVKAENRSFSRDPTLAERAGRIRGLAGRKDAAK